VTQHQPSKLKALLEETIASCSLLERRDRDPVGIVHEYETCADREVAAIFASCLAYGRVDLLRSAIRRALKPLGPAPATFLRETTPEAILKLWPDFIYRMTRGADLVDLATAIAETLRDHGTLEAAYLHGAPTDLPIKDRDLHLRQASTFVTELRNRRLRSDLHRGFRYLLPDPADGSACKRLHLFFRWMARGPDPIDLGLWSSLAPSALVMPLDTHTSRLCRYLGLLDRKSVDQKAAVEVARRLAVLDASDPLRYDFALCHLGISGRCIHRWCPERCPECPIQAGCVIAHGAS
jgi:uncharacterized protein (TIGR02757 family)